MELRKSPNQPAAGCRASGTRGLRVWDLRLKRLRMLYQEGRWQLTLSASVCLFVGLEILPDLEVTPSSQSTACLKLALLVWFCLVRVLRAAPCSRHGPGIETDTQALGKALMGGVPVVVSRTIWELRKNFWCHRPPQLGEGESWAGGWVWGLRFPAIPL